MYNHAAKVTMFAEIIVSVMHNLIEKPSNDCWISGIRMEYSDYESVEEKPSVGGFLYVAVAPITNYVSVMAYFSERPVSSSQMSTVEWQPIAYHDSCWRDDGVACAIKEANAQVKKFAEAEFSKPASELSLYLHLDSLDKFENNVLAQTINKGKMYGSLTINRPA